MRLSVKDLTFSYDSSHTVLQNVSFDYESPGILCILGVNGTGKSTLLNCIMGMENAEGEVLVDGKDVRSYPTTALARKIAYLPQDHSPIFPYNVSDVVLMGRTAHIDYFGSPGEEDEALVDEVLGFLQISHLRDKPYTEISGGERQLVLLAAELAQQPEMLLLDEPTSHLDYGNQHRFLEIVLRLHDQGMGIIMTTHNPAQALFLKGDALLLDGGKVTQYGEAVSVMTEDSLTGLYKMEMHLAEVGDRVACIPGKICRKDEGHG